MSDGQCPRLSALNSKHKRVVSKREKGQTCRSDTPEPVNPKNPYAMVRASSPCAVPSVGTWSPADQDEWYSYVVRVGVAAGFGLGKAS